MYKETDSKKVNFGVVLLFIVLAVALHTVLGMLPVLTIVKDVAFMGTMVVFVLWLIKRGLTAYEYELTEDKIIISARLGDRERARIEAEYSLIDGFFPVDEAKSENVPAQRMCTKTENNYAMIFDTGSEKHKIIFAPSDELVSLINKKLYSASEEE